MARPRSVNLPPAAPPTTLRERLTELRPARAVAVPRPFEHEGPVDALRTGRLVLRRLAPADRAEFARVMNLSRDHLAAAVGLWRDEETVDALFERQLEMARAGDERGGGWRRVGVLGDGKIAGGFNLNGITRGLTFEADATWWLAADQVGRGLAVEGARAMVEHAMGDLPLGLGLHRVQAAIQPGNARSRKVAERAGFSLQPGATVSIRLGARWELHEMHARSVLDAVNLAG